VRLVHGPDVYCVDCHFQEREIVSILGKGLLGGR
jgi:hypothetical protein